MVTTKSHAVHYDTVNFLKTILNIEIEVHNICRTVHKTYFSGLQALIQILFKHHYKNQ